MTISRNQAASLRVAVESVVVWTLMKTSAYDQLNFERMAVESGFHSQHVVERHRQSINKRVGILDRQREELENLITAMSR